VFRGKAQARLSRRAFLVFKQFYKVKKSWCLINGGINTMKITKMGMNETWKYTRKMVINKG